MAPRKLWQPDRDWSKAHVLLRGRWPVLERILREDHGIILYVNEIYRPEPRQQWLYGAGRTTEQLVERGIPIEWARPQEKIVTNAWSARTSAHGYVLPVCTAEYPNGVPAACALDVVPIGEDGKPWTADDRWDEFVALTDDGSDLGSSIGLVHFRSPGKQVWDKPHLQLKEWSDAAHDLVLPAPPSPIDR